MENCETVVRFSDGKRFAYHKCRCPCEMLLLVFDFFLSLALLGLAKCLCPHFFSLPEQRRGDVKHLSNTNRIMYP